MCNIINPRHTTQWGAASAQPRPSPASGGPDALRLKTLHMQPRHQHAKIAVRHCHYRRDNPDR
jgi:hypothetical protein